MYRIEVPFPPSVIGTLAVSSTRSTKHIDEPRVLNRFLKSCNPIWHAVLCRLEKATERGSVKSGLKSRVGDTTGTHERGKIFLMKQNRELLEAAKKGRHGTRGHPLSRKRQKTASGVTVSAQRCHRRPIVLRQGDNLILHIFGCFAIRELSGTSSV